MTNHTINNSQIFGTTKEFLKALNRVLVEYYGGQDNVKPISMKELKPLLYSKKGHSYTTFSIPKKSGGVRNISAPNPRLMILLKGIGILLESVYQPTACVMGFLHGRSVVHNASAHLGQNYILNLDLKDFFPSITGGRIYGKLSSEPYCFSKEVAQIIATACTISETTGDPANHSTKSFLPQGSPASPIITNIICESLDKRLTKLAAKYHLRFTRYADDITFSSMHTAMFGENIYSDDSNFFNELRKAIEQQGFTINEGKTRLQKKGSRQEVTGLIVGDKVNVTRKYIKDLDIILYVWEKFGYSAAFARLGKDYDLKGKRRTSLPRLEQVVNGKLNYLKMVKGQNDPVYMKYRKAFDSQMELIKKKRVQENADKGDISYLASYHPDDFEKQFGAKLHIGTPDVKGSTFFELNGIRQNVNVSKASWSLLAEAQKHTKAEKRIVPWISLCMKDGRCSWLIHKGFPARIVASFTFEMDCHKVISIWKKVGLAAAMNAAESSLISSLFGIEDNDSSEQKTNPAITGNDGPHLGTSISINDFIHTLLTSKELTEQERQDLVSLISLEMSKPAKIVTIEKPVERKAKDTSKKDKPKSEKKDQSTTLVHNPDLVVRFLKNFSSGNESPIKFCTHDWDTGEFENYDDFTKKITDALKSDKDYDLLWDCNSLLTTAIRSYVQDTESVKGWGEDKIKIGIQRPKKEILEWMSSNPRHQLKELPLSVLPSELRPSSIMGEIPANFESVINAFKAMIEFRASDSKSGLYIALMKAFKNSDLEPKIDKAIKRVQCFTYTPEINDAFRSIASNVRSRMNKDTPLEITLVEQDSYYEIHILHENSYADVSLDYIKLKENNFPKFKTKLRSLCDFSIASRFVDEEGNPVFKRLVYLDKSKEFSLSEPYVIEDSKEVKGFEHIFKFYK